MNKNKVNPSMQCGDCGGTVWKQHEWQQCVDCGSLSMASGESDNAPSGFKKAVDFAKAEIDSRKLKASFY